MKRIVCMVLVLMMGLAGFAMAEHVPSRTTNDMTWFETEDDGAVIQPTLVPEKVEEAEKELEKLIAAESVTTYFGQVKDVDGNPVTLSEALELQEGEELVVHSFTPVIATGFEAGNGDKHVVMHFPSVYEAGQKVLVLFGIKHADSIEWIAVDGVGVAAESAAQGSIEMIIPEDLLLFIQENDAIVAVVSK